jgi:hypothetical protein
MKIEAWWGNQNPPDTWEEGASERIAKIKDRPT